MLKKLLLLLLSSILILLAIALVRTFMHVAPQPNLVEASQVQIMDHPRTRVLTSRESVLHEFISNVISEEDNDTS